MATTQTTIEPTQSLRRTASWILREKATKRVICETFLSQAVEALNTAKYEAVPVLEYLCSLNEPRCVCGHYQINHPAGGECIIAGCECVLFEVTT